LHLLQDLVKPHQAALILAPVVLVAAGAGTAKLFSGAASSAATVALNVDLKFRFKVFHGERCSPIGFDFQAFQVPLPAHSYYKNVYFEHV